MPLFFNSGLKNAAGAAKDAISKAQEPEEDPAAVEAAKADAALSSLDARAQTGDVTFDDFLTMSQRAVSFVFRCFSLCLFFDAHAAHPPNGLDPGNFLCAKINVQIFGGLVLGCKYSL